MAIIKARPGLAVWIDVEGQHLPEFDDGGKHPPGMTIRYIEAQSNKNFVVKVRYIPPNVSAI